MNCVALLRRRDLDRNVKPMIRLLGVLCISFFSWPLWATGAEKPPSIPAVPATENTKALARAHAHNDYLHERPLLDALNDGFCSVEADVFLVDGKLLVGHGRAELRSQRTLETLYLDPLLIRVRENGGEAFLLSPESLSCRR